MNYLAQALGWVMRNVYNFVSGLGPEMENLSYLAITIIITTIIVKLLVLPLQLRSSKQMKKTQELQPQVQEIQIKYKHDPQAANMKIHQLYRENGASMTGGCLPLLIQLPIILAFFRVMQDPNLYVFHEAGMYDSMLKTFFWIKDLTLPDPYWYGLPLITGVVTYLQTLTTPKVGVQAQEQAANMSMMNYIMPVMIFWFALKYPGGLALYWTVSTVFSAVQSLISNWDLLFKKGE